MSRRSVTHLSAEKSRRTASTRIVPAHLCEVDADRPKRIDKYIDYFGRIGAPRNVVTSATCDGSLVEADGAH